MNDKVFGLYTALKGAGADVGTEKEFNDHFFARGDQGYKNRYEIWKTFYDAGADVGKNYEEFRDWLGLQPKPKPGQQAPQSGIKTQKPSSAPAATPKPQQHDSVNAENGYIFTEGGLDSLQQGYPARYVEAPTSKSPDDTPVGTPWGTEGSATGKSRPYNPTAPGQVRSTELPSGVSYQTPFRPDLTVAQRDEIERENNFAVEQNQKLIQDFNDEEKRRNKPLVDTGNNTVNQSVIKTQGQWDDELQRGISKLGSIISPMVSDAMKKADETWWKVMTEGSQVPRFVGMEMADLKRANDATDPDKILQGLQKSLKAAYDTPQMKAEIEKQANALGIPKDEYLTSVVAPALQQRLSSEFANSQIASRLPKNTTEYILQGLNNSVLGMLGSVATQTLSQRRFATQAQAMTDEGLNPHYDPGVAARLAQMGVTFAADAPFFGLYGKIGGNVVKQVAEQQIKNLMAKGLSEGAARSLVGTALENSAGARMRQYIMQHVGSSAITMGGFNLTSEGARQMHEGEFDPKRLAESTAEGLATGAAFGVTGGAAQAITQPLTGISRVGAKAAGFGVEAETLYATEELAKMMHGEEGFTNPFEGSVEALMKLGVMKASSGHLLTKALETGVSIKENGLSKTVAKSIANGQPTGIKFTPDEEAYIRNSIEGKNLLESLSQMHPEVAVSEVNGKKKLTPEGEQMRQQLSDSYNRFMANTEIPATVKQKVALTLGGLYRPGLETGSDIIHGDDDSVTLKTRDKDFNCIQELKFDNYSDAESWREEHEGDFRLNDAVNMFNGSTVEARAKMVAELMEEYGVDATQARSMIEGALHGSNGTDFNNEQFLSIYDAIRRNAYPDDELNVQRRYWEGMQLSDEEKHSAFIAQKIAEMRLSHFGKEFADEVINSYPDEKMAELAQRKDITGKQLQAALDYYNKSAVIDGMMDETSETIDQKVDAANSFIQKNAHPDTGMLITGTAQGNNVYVTAGHFQLSPDGRLIPTDNSGAVIVRDINTGEIGVVNPNEVRVTSINDPKVLIASNDSMEGLRGQLTREAENVIEMNPDTPEQPINNDFYTGVDGQRYLSLQITDEQGRETWVKVPVDEQGTPIGDPQPLDIDEYRKAKSDEKDLSEMPQEEFAVTDETPGNPEEPIEPQPENVIEAPVNEASVENAPVQRIPVDENGKMQYEQAASEDTLAYLNEKYGEEKAQKMIATIAANAAKELENLQNEDTSKFTDMADLDAHEEKVLAAEQKVKYWQELMKPEEKAVAEEKKPDKEELPAQEPTIPDTENADSQVVNEQQSTSPAKPAQPETPVTPPAEPAKPAEPAQPAGPTAEQKIAQGTVKNNIGKRFGFQNQDGTRSEVVIDAFKGDDLVTVTRQDYDKNGRPKGEPYQDDFKLTDVGNSIVNGIMKPALTTDEKLRKVFKVTVGDIPLADVLTEEEQRQLLDLIAKKDNEAVGNLTGDLIDAHHEDLILRGRDIRNAKVDQIMNSNASREQKLRKVRDLYKGYADAEVMLEDETLTPGTIEEYVADLHSRVPKKGEGPIAYFSYEKDGTPITGLQDETGYGKKNSGDADAFKPWLAPQGKGVSLMKYAEQIHSQLPEPIQEQFDVNEVRNAILNIFGGAERPSDITTMVIKRGIIQAEQAARRQEEMWIDGGPSLHKVSADDNSFTGRLTRAKQQTNTEPTDGQKDAGNYKKGHVSFGGYDFVVENPEGSVRRGEANGKKWEQKMNNTYGYILGRYGKDGDHLDMFINDNADLDNWNGKVYVIDQVDPKTGAFDEHKVMYGFNSEAEARDAYLSNYEKGWKGLGKITGVSKDKFDEWLDSSKRKFKPFAEHSVGREAAVEEVRERIGEMEAANNAEAEKQAKPATPYERDKVLMDTYIGHMADGKMKANISTDIEEAQRILDDYYKSKAAGESVDSDEVKAQKVSDKEELERLEKEPTVKRYRAMQLIDGKLYPPMSAKVNGEMREPTEIGVWEKAEERPDLVKNGKFVLNKGQKGQGNVPAAYNPYFHTSTSGLNDQFTSAYKRPELVVVEVEIPESELTSGYKAEGAKDAVGNVDWHSGVVNGQLPADRQRQVTLSRYSKVNRIVPDSEVADMIAKQLEGTNIEVPYNVVTPTQRAELEKRGVKISDKPAGTVTEDINGNPIKDSKPSFFKTPDGYVYGFTYQGKIYVDPRIATSETPVHEYGHLWVQMKRQSAPEEWENIKNVFLNDKLVQPIIDRVKQEYPELAKEGREDDFVEELVTQFSGKRGAERMRDMAKQIAEERGGIFGKAEAITAMQRMKNLLSEFWASIAKMMGWKYRNANDIADKMMLDFLEGMNPSEEIKGMNHKRQQLDIISRTNPMHDDYHTGIRSIDDIKTFEDAYNEGKKTSEEGGWEELASYPDITNELIEDARKTGKITVYSSYPIKDGVFVTPSMMQAKDYAGEGRVYSKRVPLDDVAWINLDEGQYAKVAKVKPQKENAVARDKEYAEAVASGDMEKVDAMLREEARRKGYTEDSSYQGSLAFNGAAPSKNGYFETREERKQAMEDGTFEDTFSLGDYAEAGIDANDLEWQLANPMNASAGDKATLASIRNINNALKSKNGKIKMYRAVDAAIKENSFRNGDWVTPSREYAEQHIGLQDWKKGRIIEQEVPIDDIWWNGDDINEWGYDDGKGYAYKNTKNNRKLMEPTYDKDGNLIPLSQRFNDRKDDIMFQMMGKKGAAEADKLENNAKRMESLKLAEEAEEGGYDAKAIKFATGWERGADGKWRYEIPDADVDIVNAYKQARLDHDKEVARLSKEEDGLLEQYQHLTNIIPGRIDSRYSEEQKAKYREMRKQREKLWKQYLKAGEKVKEYDEQGVSMSLGELMGEDNEVFKYYPELKDVRVSFTSMQGGTAGSFGEDGIKIGYNELKRFDNDELNNENVYATLLHEVQHAIQDIEGFASGGNLYTSTTEEGISAIVEKKQRKAADIKQRLDANRKILSDPEELKAAAELDGKSEKEVKEQLMETIDQQAAEYDTLNNQIEYIKNTKAPAKSDAVDLYRRLSGEVESRNVESRMKLTDQERMATLASETEDVPRDEQVIIMSNGKAMNINDIKPVGTGDFGDIYDQFKGMPKEAVDFLVKKKGGDLLGVFHRDEVGDIDLVWGESYNRYKGKGLSHIIKKHIDTLHDFKDVDELTSVLEDVINNGEMGDDYAIEKDGYRVVIAKEKDGKRWILTAFDNSKTKKEKASRTSLNTPSVDKGEGAVSPDASLSESKDSKNINSLQENSEKSASEGPKFQKAPVFISNALKAAEDIKQEKATPEQWLAMLQKNGGLKAGEDKWLGLSDWLKEQKGSVTKQDVLDYIRKNQIEVEEVPYQEYFDVDNLPKMQEFGDEFNKIKLEIEGNRSNLEVELDKFEDEMSKKYGYGWYIKLNDEEKAYAEKFEQLNSTEGTPDEKAFREMVDRYGDDFEMAFEVDGNGRLVPQMDMYGDDISDAAKHFLVFDVQPINSTRLGYTTNGLENKREIALTVPTIEPWNEGDQIHFGDAGNGRAVAWVRFGDTEEYDKAAKEALDAADKELYDYLDRMTEKYDVNPDYPERLEDKLTPEEKAEHERIMANIHEKEAAFDATKKKVLVIDEIQSKRHQEGREKGYDIPVTQLKKNGWRFIKAGNSWTLYDPDKKSRMQNIYAETEQEAWRQLESLTRSMGLHHGGIVPSAPFEKNWHELAMKRMLRYAAENGYDKIAWTTGDQQADRYKIGDKIKDISVSVATDPMTGKPLEGKYEIFPHNQNNSTIMVDGASGVMDKDQVLRVYGKDLGQRMIDAADKAGVDGDVLSGDALRIGAEGMKGFYDDILPRFMNKYGKKWGVKVGEVELPDLEKSAQKMWSIDVTPEMKESVMQGQPMFQRASQPESELTPEKEQYWKQWEAAMKKWKERNNIPADAEGVGEKPVYHQGEDIMDFAGKMSKWVTERNLWQTAPKLEDYHQARNDKADADEAHAYEKQYPDSEHARRWRVAADLARIRHAMSRQKTYDKATVKAVTDFANDFMKMGYGDHLTRGEIERMLSSVKNATGSKDVKKQLDNIMNVLMNSHLRNLESQVWKLASIKELKQTAQGVETQGRLELKGQRMIQAFRDATQTRMTVGEIRNRMEEVAERMTRNDKEAPMWEQEYEGLGIALQYAENIEESRKEWAEIDREYKEAVKDYKTSGRSYQAQQQLLESLEQAKMDNIAERIANYGGIIGRLEGNIAESIQGAKEFVEREKQRVKKIHDMANFDLAGKDMGGFHQSDWKKRLSNGTAARFFLGPLGTFEQMLKQFGARNANGEGYLYDYFMRNWMKATDNAYIGERNAKEELDEKAHELFGDKIKRWSDLYELERTLPTMDITVTDQGEQKTFTLTQGNLMYICMADKMNDGRMKLRKMGITEEDVEQIKDFLDPRLVQLADWLQGEYLPKKRPEYNKVHERMFGAPMAAIDNYFPLKILGDARVKEEDVNVPDSETLPSTITGNIIKRRKNALPLDILNTDALSLAIEHVEDMERWAAQAEWNKDVNTLLSYTTFRNKVKNMNTIYGSGDQLWNAFKDAAKMAAGTYSPKVSNGSTDKAISNIAKGVTAAKISFRAYTAFKQILSAPAFLHDVDLKDFVKAGANPYGSWKWAMENMPVFEKRWKSRQVGDTRLMDDPTDWKLWKNNVVQLASRWGMSPNALVDGVTCAVGARAIYETRLKKYKEMGMEEDAAKKRALQDAEIGYNLTQQSSEGAFVSQIQKDRTVAANMLSVFRNSSMAYTRQWVDAARNLKHRMQQGYREDSIKFMTRQFQDQLGLDEAQAQDAAEAAYNRAGRHDVARLLNMMYGVTIAWNLGASLPYLLIGDDDKTKKEMMTDALMRGLAAGPTEGMAAGNIYSELMGRALSEQTRKAYDQQGLGAAVDEGLSQAADYEINPLPLFADIQGMIKKLGYDKWAAAQDVFNIVAQSAVGVNPQTFTDMYNAIMDYAAPGWDGTKYTYDAENMSRAKELALFFMRVMNAPTSSWRNKYIDELGMNAEDAQKLPYEELAKRYAHYKHWKDAPIMGWMRGEEGRQEKMEKIQKQFDKAVAERIERLTDEELMFNVARSRSIDERRAIAKTIAKRLGIEKSVDGAKSKEEWQKRYQQLMTYEDIREDEILYQKKQEATARKDEKAVKAIDRALNKIRDKGKKKLGFDNDQEKMAKIRQWRREALEKALKAEATTKQ